MKIAGIIFESLLKAGGYEIFTYNLFKALAERGHDVTMYTTSREIRKRGDFYAGLPFAVRPTLFKTGSLVKRFPWAIKAFLRAQQRIHGYDVWQVMGAYPEGLAASGLSGRVPLVLRTHGDDVQSAPELGYGLRLKAGMEQIIADVLKSMDRVVALTPSAADELAELGLERPVVEVIPNGIDFERFAKGFDRAESRRKWKVGPDDFVILTVGRNHPKKGFDVIPRMAADMRQKGGEFVWLVVGADTDKLGPEITRLGLEDCVRTIPNIGFRETPREATDLNLPVDELVEVYCMSDLFVFPSRLETFGRVLLEAMAAGLPVVTTGCTGCRDVVAGGEYGRMVEVGDLEGMVRETIGLMRDEKARSDLAAKGREHAGEFDWDEIARRYEELYSRL